MNPENVKQLYTSGGKTELEVDVAILRGGGTKIEWPGEGDQSFEGRNRGALNEKERKRKNERRGSD